MEKYIIGFLSVVAVTLIIVGYSLRFPILADNSNLEENILNFMERDETHQTKITIEDSISMDNQKYVLITLDNKLGEVKLIKGLNGKYKIDSIGHGTGNFRYGVKETKKGKYFVFAGQNEQLEIAKITFQLEGHTYEISVPDKEYFMEGSKIDDTIQNKYPDLNTVKFYDKEGEDITIGMEW